MEPTISYLAIVLSGIASMIIGFLWYSKFLFGRPWMRLMGYTDESIKVAQKSLGKLYGISFLLSLLTAYMLSHVVDFSLYFYGNPPIHTGLSTAFCTWLGFVMPVQLTDELFRSKKWKLFFINTSYQLVWLVAAGLIIGLFE